MHVAGERSIPGSSRYGRIIPCKRGDSEILGGMKKPRRSFTLRLQLLRRRIDLAIRKPVAGIGYQWRMIFLRRLGVDVLSLAMLYPRQRLFALLFAMRIIRRILGQG